jgi:hypothetical protein
MRKLFIYRSLAPYRIISVTIFIVMKKNLLLFFLILLFCTIAKAGSQDSLTVEKWGFDAIKGSHIIYSKKEDSSRKDCTTSLKNISWFVQQQDKAIFSSDGCSVYISTEDGWITKFNAQTKQVVAKIRVALKTANATISKDNKILLVGNRQPADLVLLKTSDLSLVRIIPVENNKGVLSPVAKVRTAGEDHGFIVAPQDFSKIWKISYLNPAPIGFGDGWNHDYRCLDEHVGNPLFPVKRLKTGQHLNNFQMDDEGIFLVGTNKSGEGVIMDLDLSRVIAHPEIHNIESGLIWKTAKSNRLAVLDQDKNRVDVYSNNANPRRWEKIKALSIKPALTVASCENSPALWVSGREANIQLIDKNSLEITKEFFLKSKNPITEMSCLPHQKAMLLKSDNKVLIFDSQTFKQIY